MLDINDSTAEELLTAEQLLNMTVSKEELYKRQKEGLMQSLMSSMVQTATQTGATAYVAQLNPQINAALLTEVTDEFKKLGYSTVVKNEKTQQLGEYIALIIDWTGNVPERSEEQ